MLALLRFEWLLLARDGRLRAAALLLATMAALAVASSAHQQHVLAGDRSAVSASERLRWLEQGSKDPHSAAHYGQYVFQPMPWLASIDPGITRFVGVTVWLEAHAQNQFIFRPAQDDAPGQRYAQFTGAMVLQVLLPLALMLIACASIATDRERGTLREVLATGIAPARLLAAKSVAILTSFVIAPLGLATAIITLATLPASLDSALRAIGFGAAYLLYLGVFVCLGVATGALAKQSRVAFATTLAIWVLVCLIAPRFAADAADRILPLPSASALRTQIQVEMDEFNHPDQRENRKRQLLQRYGAATVEALPVNWRGVELDVSERHGNQVFDRVFGSLFDTITGQNRLHVMVGTLVSPLPSLKTISMATAGTDYGHHRRFSESAEQYRRVLVNTMNADLIPNRGPGPHRAGAELWATVPEFDPALPRAQAILTSLGLAWFSLGLWLVLALIVLFCAARRLQP